MNPQTSSTFCSVPWTQLATNSSGYYRVCCNALPVKNLIRNDEGKVLSVYQNSVDEAWNAATYQKIRTELLNSQRPEMCERCFREEDSGVESARQKWNRRWPMDSAQLSSDLGSGEVKYVDLRLGNLCNLKCRMCNPYSSSKWVEEWNSIVGGASLLPAGPLPPEEISRLQKMDWPENSKTWENLTPILNTVEEIYLTGGEPFLSLKQAELLKRLVESGRSKHVIIKYNTNATVYPEKIVNLWRHFKGIRLNMSIDGIGALNNYIRFPAQWSTIENHLQKFFLLKKEGWPLDIGVHTTVQIYNILELPQIIDYFQSTYGLVPYFNILNHPACLNIRALPLSLKQKAVQRLHHLIDVKGVREIISYMMAEDWASRYWSEFIDYTGRLDQSRNQKYLIAENHLQLVE